MAQAGLPRAKIDSLMGIWNNSTLHDTVRLRAMNTIAWDGYLRSAPDSAIYYSQQMMAFAEKRDLKRYIGWGLNIQGVALFNMGRIEEAQTVHSRNLKVRSESGDRKGMANTLSNLATIKVSQGDWAKAMEFMRESHDICESLNDQACVASALNNMGLLLKDQGELESALEHLNKAHAIWQKLGNRKGVASTYANMSLVYKLMGKWDLARVNLEQSTVIREAINDLRGLSANYNNMGDLYHLPGKLDTAMFYYEKGLALLEKMGDLDGISIALSNLAQVSNDRGDFKRALELGQRALKLANEAGNPVSIMNATESLSVTYRALGRPADALSMLDLYIAMRDSVNREENQREVLRQRFKFEFEKKEAMLKAEQDKKNAIAIEQIRRKNQQRNALVAGLILMLGLAGVSYRSYATKKKDNIIIKNEKARSHALLRNILPRHTIKEMLNNGKIAPKHFESVSVLFTDFEDFTTVASEMTPDELILQLNICFSAFDRIVEKHGLEKIKTIGDSYMAASGIPISSETHAVDCVKAALDMVRCMKAIGGRSFRIRIGIHSGPVVAGIVGVKKFQYDI